MDFYLPSFPQVRITISFNWSSGFNMEIMKVIRKATIRNNAHQLSINRGNIAVIFPGIRFNLFFILKISIKI